MYQHKWAAALNLAQSVLRRDRVLPSSAAKGSWIEIEGGGNCA